MRRRLAVIGALLTSCTHEHHHHAAAPATFDTAPKISIDHDEIARASRSATRPPVSPATGDGRVAHSAMPGPGSKIPTPPASAHAHRGETTSTGGGPGIAPAAGDVWDRLAVCESGNTNDHGAPYFGYWQFDLSTWHANGGTGRPDEHTRAEQLTIAKALHARRGWQPWPGCARKLGLAA